MARRIRETLARVVNAAIEAFNEWLASERGFVQAVILTAVWTVAVVAGLDKHGFVFLYVATAVSFVTQFNLAIIGRRSGVKLDRALEQIDTVVDQVLVATETLLQLARNEASMQEALAAQTEAIAEALEASRPGRRR